MPIPITVAGLASVGLCAVLAGCTAPGATGPALPSPAASTEPVTTVMQAPGHVTATITQQRRDQIKRVVSLRLTFDDPAPASITDVHLDLPGFVRQSAVPWQHAPVLIQPNVAVALPVELAPPDCSAAASPGPASASVVVDDGQGRPHRLTMTGLADAGLLERIRSHDCAVASLEERARFTLGAQWVPAIHDGRQVWRGYVDITRGIPSGSAIEVTGALGSVLVDFTPMAPLPWPVPEQPSSRLPIEARSSGRCDGHSMGESSKPFVFTLWVMSQGAQVPLVLSVPKADQAAWWSLLSNACAAAD